jgi:hypothetical protein
MGWWKIQNTEPVIGDEVFSLLRQASLAVAAMYERELGRRPSKEEWKALIEDALQPSENDGADGVSLFMENARPIAVEIVIASTPHPDHAE